MNWTIDALYALDFMNLSEFQALEILKIRNDEGIRKWMLNPREITKNEHLKFIENLKNDHARAYFAIMKNPLLLEKNFADLSPDSHFTHKDSHFAREDSHLESCDFSALKNIDSDEILGVVSLSDIDLHNMHAWLGIYANPRCQNVGNLLLYALRHIAFVRFGLHMIFAKVLSTNARALRFYEKNDFISCARLPDFIKRNDEFIDALVLALKNKVA